MHWHLGIGRLLAAGLLLCLMGTYALILAATGNTRGMMRVVGCRSRTACIVVALFSIAFGVALFILAKMLHGF